MLALTVKPGESIVVGEATITIGTKNKVYVDAPKRVRVIRSSILEREKRDGKEIKKQNAGKESPGEENQA